jgi:hypothetical protein
LNRCPETGVIPGSWFFLIVGALGLRSTPRGTLRLDAAARLSESSAGDVRGVSKNPLAGVGALWLGKNWAKSGPFSTLVIFYKMKGMDSDDPDNVPEYSAFEKWEYQQVIFKGDQDHSWRNFADSYFFACEPLIKELAAGRLREDIEGTAAVFLFRHYLELALKSIVFSGRLLIIEDENMFNAFKTEVKEVARIHILSTLWDWVLQEVKPKVEHWDNYDTESVEKCIKEFDAVDPKGFAFRYRGHGGEFCRYDFEALSLQMDHIRQVLDGISTCLYEARQEIREYEEYLDSEFGLDQYE